MDHLPYISQDRAMPFQATLLLFSSILVSHSALLLYQMSRMVC